MSTLLADSVRPPAAGRRTSRLIVASVGSLRQLSDVLSVTSDEQYIRKPVGVIASSLGGHVRHCLDHFEALLAGAAGGLVDYDHRERATAIETERLAAIRAIRGLVARLLTLDQPELNRPVRVAAMLASDGWSIETESSLGRELVFVLSHTVHHHAIMAAMCATLGIQLPVRFGYAPSTLAHLDRAGDSPSESYR